MVKRTELNAIQDKREAEILAYIRANPELTNKQIGEHFKPTLAPVTISRYKSILNALIAQEEKTNADS